jgi:predicted NAD-dependent protein-ADP-ribosyltransferase YbiA (DUF1768 family)
MALLDKVKTNLEKADSDMKDAIAAAIADAEKALLSQAASGEDRFQWSHKSARVMTAVAEHFKESEGLVCEQRDGLLVLEWPR